MVFQTANKIAEYLMLKMWVAFIPRNSLMVTVKKLNFKYRV